MKATYKRILICIRKYMAFVVMSLIAAAVTVIAQLYLPILAGNAIDYIVGPGDCDMAAVGYVLKKMIIVIAIAAASQWIMNLLNNKIRYKNRGL